MLYQCTFHVNPVCHIYQIKTKDGRGLQPKAHTFDVTMIHFLCIIYQH